MKKTASDEEVPVLVRVKKSKYPQLFSLLKTRDMSRSMTALQLLKAGVLYLKEHPETADLLFSKHIDFGESPACTASAPAVISEAKSPAEKPAPSSEKKLQPATDSAGKEPLTEVLESQKPEKNPEKIAPENGEEKSGNSEKNPDNSKGGIADIMGGEGFSI